MTTRQNAYYERTRDGETSPLVQQATTLAKTAIHEQSLVNVAVDCGCGSGRHLAYLRDQGFEVHGFDIEPDAIRWCEDRFNGDTSVHLDVASFETYAYPKAALVMAFASLFFCPADGFEEAWSRIVSSIVPGGIFFGMFMGTRDEWATRETSFGSTLTFDETGLRSCFTPFEIIDWHERDEEGGTALGARKHWHTYSVTARKVHRAVARSNA